MEDPRVPINADTIDTYFDGSPSKSGANVNADNALTISSLWRGISVLGGAASSIPHKVYKKTSTGREEVKASELPAVDIITKRPNNKITAPVWMDRAINHLHMRGNHFAHIIKNELGQSIALEMWNPDTVEVFEDRLDVFYKRKGDDKVFTSDKVIHVPHLGSGIVGKSTVTYAKEDIGLEMSRRDYGSGVYAGGARPPALLKPANPITDTQREQGQKVWNDLKKKGGDVLMPYGMDYQALSFKPEEIEFLQAGNFSVATMARWLGVPPHKLYDLDRATFSNIEHLAIEFLQDTIAPILVKFEAEYTSKLFQLPIEQKRGYYTKFNMNAYVRADIVARYTAYGQGVHAGVLKPKEARSLEELEFAEGSDRLFINSGSVPLDKMDEFINKKGQSQPLTKAQRDRLKAEFNGQTEKILDILGE